MQGDHPVSWLMFFTLAATIFIIAGAFIYFLRSRHSREIAAEALQGNDSRVGATPNGAGPELVGFAVIGIAVMGLLAVGYSSKPKIETAQTPPPVGQSAVTTVGQSTVTPASPTAPSGSTTGNSQGMAQPAGTANQPKVYQPANPTPDTRSAPTSSDTGVGPENGTTGQPK